MTTRPRILITVDTTTVHRRGVPFPAVELKTAYVTAVATAGGLPLLVAPTTDPEEHAGLLDIMDGLVVSGGAFDIDPAMYGEDPGTTRIDTPKPDRTHFEAALIDGALRRQRPILGVCGGMQLLNVALGGTLVKDIGTEVPGALEHEQPTSPAGPGHRIDIVESSVLRRLAGAASAEVNSTHHQAVGRLAPGMEIEARAPDGVVEAIAHSEHPWVRGVQWHPELLQDSLSAALYAGLVEASIR